MDWCLGMDDCCLAIVAWPLRIGTSAPSSSTLDATAIVAPIKNLSDSIPRGWEAGGLDMDDCCLAIVAWPLRIGTSATIPSTLDAQGGRRILYRSWNISNERDSGRTEPLFIGYRFDVKATNIYRLRRG